ncbi:unnamed protein product [Prunus armeniaca]
MEKVMQTNRYWHKRAISNALVPHTFNQARSEMKCVKYIIKDEIPFRAVEGTGFKSFIHDLQPRFMIPNWNKLAKGVWDLFLVEKTNIMSMISDQRVSIITDTWTSIQNINYMVVTAHFMNHEWKLHKRIINFVNIKSHKGDDIGRCLDACLNSWGIKNVFSITVDNASANDGAVKYMAKRFKSLNTLMLDNKYLHMRCACHILNLVVKDRLKELSSSIAGIRNCVKYIYSSPSRLDKFRDFTILESMKMMTNIPLDVATRWNATYKMFYDALKYKNVFTRMVDENAPFVAYFNELEKDGKKQNLMKKVGPPTESDWENTQAFVHFLKKFYETTLKLSATKTCTSNIMFTELVGLQVEIERKMKDDGGETLQKTLDGSLPYSRLACAILKPNLQRGVGSLGPLQTLDEGDEYGLEDELDGDDAYSQMLKEMLLQRKEEQQMEISNEVDKYFVDPFENPMNKNFNLLDWWEGNQSRYPILSKVANDIFAIHSSTEPADEEITFYKELEEIQAMAAKAQGGNV